ncbi:MAG TPA: prepilin-type N-terminal cleavage/methylation domain-containing protein [Candidatus Angelobacter sp.]|nr:prepilin-type N-terminal cleavage/methylation domain-containing protein [Candidatus Angelobacter sp.]HKT52705.1 prepilin-type N-terminal cleavage/methylation domain-containing protein [Candidatus Angelobacter sp.]
MKRADQGFSLIELIIVMVLMLIIAAIAVPNIQRIVRNYRLESSGHGVAGLLQQARMKAVQNNAPAYAIFDNTNSPNLAFVNGDPAVTNYVSGNPDVALNSALNMVTVQGAGVPDHGQLDSYLGVTGGAGGAKVQTSNVVGFNARGLPCVEGAAGPVVCQQQDTTGALPVFEWFISDGNGGWEAVTVTAAGRTKTWRLSQTGAGSASICGFQACWQ